MFWSTIIFRSLLLQVPLRSCVLRGAQLPGSRPQRHHRRADAEEADATAPGRQHGAAGGVPPPAGAGGGHRRHRRHGPETHSRCGAE